MDMYTGRRRSGAGGPLEYVIQKNRSFKREKLITKLENLGIGTKLCPGCILKNLTKFPTCLRCKSDISGVEESQEMAGGGTRNDTGSNPVFALPHAPQHQPAVNKPTGGGRRKKMAGVEGGMTQVLNQCLPSPMPHSTSTSQQSSSPQPKQTNFQLCIIYKLSITGLSFQIRTNAPIHTLIIIIINFVITGMFCLCIL